MINHQIQRLASKLKKGDPKAFEDLFHIFEYKILSFIVSYTKSIYIAEDITQEVFIKVWNNRKKINPDKNFQSYIFTIAKRMVLNYMRDYMSKTTSLEDQMHREILCKENIESKIIYEEYQYIVEEIVNTFPKKMRSIYIMSRNQGKSHYEIANILGISKKTVKNNLWEALVIIKKHLSPYLEYPISVALLLHIIQ